ncbi:MAG: 23S rRNA (uracil(1939)-C(5))-methyltransferase RlmD [Steroidobacteraceae bacterium]
MSALTHGGEGIVKGGKTAFVAGALPGELIRFERTRRHRQHDDGRLIEVLEAAPERVTPRCAHFGVCGGCALQHLAPQQQIAAKQRELADNLFRIARTEPRQWLAPLAGPEWNYRRRARLGARYVTRKGRVCVGFRERAAPYVADCRRCEVLAPPADALLDPLARLIESLSIRERVPQVEVAIGDQATVLVLRILEPVSQADRTLLIGFEARHRVKLLLQPGGLDSLAPVSDHAAELTYALPDFDLTFAFTAVDFVQVNDAMNRALVTRAVELLAITLEDRVLDLFCGLGNFTLALARRAAAVSGVEGDPGLLERASTNARRNGVTNASFHAANLAVTLEPTLPWLRERYTKVLLDPPRAGAQELLPAIAGLRASRILYISCHPGTLARDVGILVHQLGYSVSAAGVLDMFPHTTHVESMVLLEADEPRRSGKPA